MSYGGLSVMCWLIFALWLAMMADFLDALSAASTTFSIPPRESTPPKFSAYSNGYLTAVTDWLDEEGVSWQLQHAKQIFPKVIATKQPMLKLGSSNTDLYLHLLKTPKSLKECVTPTLNRDMTNYIQHLNSNSNTSKISLIHLHEDVWDSKTEIVKSRLRMRLGRTAATAESKIFARKTVARRVTSEVAVPFLQEHHLWSATKARYYYGLYFNDTLVAVATFSSRRRIHTLKQNHDDEDSVQNQSTSRSAFELLRFCTRRDGMVIGAISKLLKAFIRDHGPDDIVTVVDRDWGPGDGWHSVGFKTLHVMAPVLMTTNKEGERRHLVGAGIQNSNTQSSSKRINQSTGRPGLEMHVLEELADLITHEQALHCLDKWEYYLVYDAGVERLHMVVSDKAGLDLVGQWKTSVPNYAPTHFSENMGIRVLLAHITALTTSFAYGTPLSGITIKKKAFIDDSSAAKGDIASWKTTGGTARNATLLYSEPSTMDPPASVEVRERPGGWCTLGIVGGATKSIYHGNYKLVKGGIIDPSVLVSEYLRSMAAMAMAGLEFRRNGAVVEDTSDLSFLYLGYGAGSLPRFMSNSIPGSRNVAIELDEGVVKTARNLELVNFLSSDSSSTVQLELEDALAYRRSTSSTGSTEASKSQDDFFDVVFIDIFDGKNECPKDFYSKDFLKHAQQNLLGGKSEGMIIHNFHTGGKVRRAQLEDAIKGYRNAFTTAITVESVSSNPTGGNTILLATNKRRLDATSETLSWHLAGIQAQNRWGVEFDVVARATNKLWLT